MLLTAESMLGPYVWGVYDLLVLPPSFPYGGMENPCLTFVTPTCIVSSRASVFICSFICIIFTAAVCIDVYWQPVMGTVKLQLDLNYDWLAFRIDFN